MCNLGAYVFFDYNMCVILSLQEAISVPWTSLPRKVSKLYFAMRGLLNYSVVASKLNKQSGEKLCGTYQNAADLSAVACLSTIA